MNVELDLIELEQWRTGERKWHCGHMLADFSNCQLCDARWRKLINDERKRIIAKAREWSGDWDSGAEGADMPDFEICLAIGKAFRQFANELENETCE